MYYILVGVIVLSCFPLLYLITHEFKSNYHQGFSKYFKETWNWVDIMFVMTILMYDFLVLSTSYSE